MFASSVEIGKNFLRKRKPAGPPSNEVCSQLHERIYGTYSSMFASLRVLSLACSVRARSLVPCFTLSRDAGATQWGRTCLFAKCPTPCLAGGRVGGGGWGNWGCLQQAGVALVTSCVPSTREKHFSRVREHALAGKHEPTRTRTDAPTAVVSPKQATRWCRTRVCLAQRCVCCAARMPC